MHAHGDSIEYRCLWMVILIRTLLVSHFSMAAQRGLFYDGRSFDS